MRSFEKPANDISSRYNLKSIPKVERANLGVQRGTVKVGFVEMNQPAAPASLGYSVLGTALDLRPNWLRT